MSGPSSVSAENVFQGSIDSIKAKLGQLNKAQSVEKITPILNELTNEIHSAAKKIDELVAKPTLSRTDQEKLLETRAVIKEAYEKISTLRKGWGGISDYCGDRGFWRAVLDIIGFKTSVKLDQAPIDKSFKSAISKKVVDAFLKYAPTAEHPNGSIEKGVWGATKPMLPFSHTAKVWVSGPDNKAIQHDYKVTTKGILVDGKTTCKSWEEVAGYINAVTDRSAMHLQSVKRQEAEKYVFSSNKPLVKGSWTIEGQWYLTKKNDNTFSIHGGPRNGQKLCVTLDGKYQIGNEPKDTLAAFGLTEESSAAENARVQMNETKKLLLNGSGVVGHYDELWMLKGKNEKVFVFTEKYAGKCITFDGKGKRQDASFEIKDTGDVFVEGKVEAREIFSKKSNASMAARKIAGVLEQNALNDMAVTKNILGDDKNRVTHWLSTAERAGSFWIEGAKVEVSSSGIKEASSQKQSSVFWNIVREIGGAVVEAAEKVTGQTVENWFPNRTYSIEYYDQEGTYQSAKIDIRSSGFTATIQGAKIEAPTTAEFLEKVKNTLKTPKTLEQMMFRVIDKEKSAAPVLASLKGMMGFGKDSILTQDVVEQRFHSDQFFGPENKDKMTYLVWKDAQNDYHVSVRNPGSDDVSSYDLDVVSKPGSVILKGNAPENMKEIKLQFSAAKMNDLPKALARAQGLKSQTEIVPPEKWDLALQRSSEQFNALMDLCYPENAPELTESSFDHMVKTVGEANAPHSFFPMLMMDGTVQIKHGEKTDTVVLPKEKNEQLQVNGKGYSNWNALLEAVVGKPYLTPVELKKRFDERARIVETLQSHPNYRSDTGETTFAQIRQMSADNKPVPISMWLLRDAAQEGVNTIWRVAGRLGIVNVPAHEFVLTECREGNKEDHPISLTYKDGAWKFKSGATTGTLDEVTKQWNAREDSGVAVLENRLKTYRKLVNQIESNNWIGEKHSFYSGVVPTGKQEELGALLQKYSLKPRAVIACVFKDEGGKYYVARSQAGGKTRTVELQIDSITGQIIMPDEGEYRSFSDLLNNKWMQEATSKTEYEAKQKKTS